MTTPTLDRPPAGWHVVDVMLAGRGRRDWVALMLDVPCDDFKRGRPGRSAWVTISGKHRDEDAARAALEGMIATRH